MSVLSFAASEVTTAHTATSAAKACGCCVVPGMPLQGLGFRV